MSNQRRVTLINDFTVCFLPLYLTDFDDFSSARLDIIQPNIIEPSGVTGLDISTYCCKNFETETKLVVSLAPPILCVPAPFEPKNTLSPPSSVATPPSYKQIIFQHPRTKIIIREGK